MKLTSGEELIAKIVDTSKFDENLIAISNPLSVAPGPQGLGLVPSLFTSDLDNPVVLNTNTVTMYSIPDRNIEDKYITATTGITLPDKKLILG